MLVAKIKSLSEINNGVEEYSHESNNNENVRFIDIDIAGGNEEIEFDEIEDFNLFLHKKEILVLNSFYSHLNENIFLEMLTILNTIQSISLY